VVGNFLVGIEGHLLETLTRVKRTLNPIRRLGPQSSTSTAKKEVSKKKKEK